MLISRHWSIVHGAWRPACLLALYAFLLGAGGIATGAQQGEASFESAKNWWPPQRNVWTPVGVKSHPFRFNLLYNGTIVAEPHPLRDILGHQIKTYLMPYAGLGVQLSFSPSLDGVLPPDQPHPYQLSSRADGGVGAQGWDENHAAPVLWTRWPGNYFYVNSGVVVRQEVFARTANGEEVKTGKEPIYLWIRFVVEHVDSLDAQPTAIIFANVGNPEMMQRSMFHEDNLKVLTERSPYPRVLTRDSYAHGDQSCCRLLEADGKVRLVAMTSTGSALLSERAEGSRDYFLKIEVPAVKGAHVDMLLPMIPMNAEQIRAEADLGFDAALADSDKAWSDRPDTAAIVDTPELQVNAAVRRLIELAQVVAETNPESGERAFLTGSWNYDTLWPTPACMTAHMLLDQLGYHDFTADNLEIFRAYQGSAKAPGDAYELHPGYFCAPRQLSSVDWLTDHGSILHAVAEHALLSGDEKFTEHWLEPILKACEFIRESRVNVNHDGYPGVLPPAVATDANIPIQGVWNIAWNYKGLDSAARLLMRIGHPEADKYRQEAHDYKETFVKAFREHTAKMPTWTSDDGVVRPIVPTTLAGDEQRSHPFFLDTGPMVLVYAGLLSGDDKLMQDSLAYYREGPNVKLYDPRGNMHQRAILTHEISSCEPCYSFNILCSWHAGDRQRFLEGVYGLLAGGMSQQTFSGCEHRHGIYGLLAPGALMFYSMKLAVIDDALNAEELHLLRLAPLAWIKTDYVTRFENMPTEYGPVDLKFGLSPNGKQLDVSFTPYWRHKPQRVVVHIPSVPGLEKLVVNGKEYAAAGESEIILE